MKFLLLLFALSVIAMFTFCERSANWQDCTPLYSGSQSRDAGVIVNGYCSNGYIENSNTYSVRVEAIVKEPNGAYIQWRRRLTPGESFSTQVPCDSEFRISDTNGETLGVIAPRANSEAESYDIF